MRSSILIESSDDAVDTSIFGDFLEKVSKFGSSSSYRKTITEQGQKRGGGFQECWNNWRVI